MRELTNRQTNIVLDKRSGSTYRAIASKLGISPGRVHQLYMTCEGKLAVGTHVLNKQAVEMSKANE